MASNQEYPNFRSLVCTLFVVFCWLKPQGHYALNQNLNNQKPLFHTVSVSSLVSINDQSSCNNVIPSSTSNGASKRKASLRVTHRYGACSGSPKGGNNKAETRANLAHELLSHDQARVKSIKARLEKFTSNKDLSDKKTTSLPAQRGTAFGSLNYVVEIGIGTPAKQLSLVFDTGSDITWTQCQPCATSCYQQQQPIFDPSKSTSYSSISCSAPLCSELLSATGNSPRCVSSTCVYEVKYGDNSYSVGGFAKETLKLSEGGVLENIPFGCGQNNKGLFERTAGIIGLGPHPISIISQTAQQYGKVFSYCLPTQQSTSGGYLSFGKNGLNANLQYTPFSTVHDLFYKIQMTAVNVGGSPVPISATNFQSDGESVIDSGTVITRLPASIYIPLRDTFRNQMTDYKMAQPISIFDTCYDFSNYTTVQVPTISFSFSGSNVNVDVGFAGLLYGGRGPSQVCLAFAGDSINIFGNSQQQTLEVVYDVAGGKIGFAPNACT